MATIPATATPEEYGIGTETAGITVESETITETPVVETVPDQKNAVANEVQYDTRYDLKLTYRGTKLAHTAHPASGSDPRGGDTVAYGGHVWAVDSHEKAGAYNGLRRYNLSAHRFENYPDQGA